ncbi:MAG: carbohydrate kinase family protein [Thermoplasmataceae archaeon]
MRIPGKNEFLAFIGHINIDIVLKVKSIGDMVSTPVTQASESFGGTAGNFSLIASVLDFPFDPISIVSKNTHASYIEELRKRNVNIDFLRIVDDDMGPSCYAVTDGEKQRYYMVDGPMARENYLLPGKFYEFIHSSTGLPEKNLSFIENTPHKNVIFDPGQEAGSKYSSVDIKKFLDISNMLVCNDHELKIIEKLSNMKFNDILSMGIDIIETKGAEGTVIYKNGKTIRVKADKPTQIKDTIGAGDSFRSGLYSGLFHGHDLNFSVLCGNIVASNVVQEGIMEFNLSWESVENKAKNLKESHITS